MRFAYHLKIRRAEIHLGLSAYICITSAVDRLYQRFMQFKSNLIIAKLTPD